MVGSDVVINMGVCLAPSGNGSVNMYVGLPHIVPTDLARFFHDGSLWVQKQLWVVRKQVMEWLK